MLSRVRTGRSAGPRPGDRSPRPGPPGPDRKAGARPGPTEPQARRPRSAARLPARGAGRSQGCAGVLARPPRAATALRARRRLRMGPGPARGHSARKRPLGPRAQGPPPHRRSPARSPRPLPGNPNQPKPRSSPAAEPPLPPGPGLRCATCPGAGPGAGPGRRRGDAPGGCPGPTGRAGVACPRPPVLSQGPLAALRGRVFIGDSRPCSGSSASKTSLKHLHYGKEKARPSAAELCPLEKPLPAGRGLQRHLFRFVNTRNKTHCL